MALPARRLVRAPARAVSQEQLLRLVRFPAVRKAISSALTRAVPERADIPGARGRFISFRVADPRSFHPDLYATIPVGSRGTLLRIGTPRSQVRRPRQLAAFLSRMRRTLKTSDRKSLVYQLRSAGIIGGSRTQSVLVPIERVKAVAARFLSRPAALRKVGTNPLTELEHREIIKRAKHDMLMSNKYGTLSGEGNKLNSAFYYGRAAAGKDIAHNFSGHRTNPLLATLGIAGNPCKRNADPRADYFVMGDPKASGYRDWNSGMVCELPKHKVLVTDYRKSPPVMFRTWIEKDSGERAWEVVHLFKSNPRRTVKQWCKFCGRTMRVKDWTCDVCAWKLGKGPLTVKYPPKKNPLTATEKKSVLSSALHDARLAKGDKRAGHKEGEHYWTGRASGMADVALKYGPKKNPCKRNSDHYFIVLDEAPIKGHSTPKYDLLFGDPKNAIGTMQASATTIRSLLAKVPSGEVVYRTHLQRTEGKTDTKIIGQGLRKNPGGYWVTFLFAGKRESEAGPFNTWRQAKDYAKRYVRQLPGIRMVYKIEGQTASANRKKKVVRRRRPSIKVREPQYAPNAPVQQVNIPFRSGQTITPAQMRKWIDSLQPGPLKSNFEKRFAQGLAQYKRFHLGSEPKNFTYQAVPMGASKRVTDVDFVVSEGKEWTAAYQVPTHSKKYDASTQGRYIHSHGESGVEVSEVKKPAPFSKLPERFHTADGKFVGVIPGRVKIDSWYRH